MKEKTNNTGTEETHGYVKETDKPKLNSELLERIEIENTPFTVIRVDEDWFVTMGKYRLTEKIKNKEEALAAGLDESWWRIMSVIKAMLIEHDTERVRMQIPKEEMQKFADEQQKEINGYRK